MLLATSLSAQQPVGSVTAVKKQVHVIHPQQDQILLVKPGDGVLFLDTYETQAEARARLLFEDDSLLTLGEKTKLQITENVYDPAENRRSTTLKVLSGRVRVLVGKVFTGTGSKFEIHTPTAVAAARGTYYIVWLFEQNGNLVTGVVSLAERVDVRNIDANVLGAVRLGPNQYTIVAKGKPPTAAAMIDPVLLTELLSSTELPEVWLEAIPAPTVRPGGVEEVRPPGIKPPGAPVRLPAEEGGVPPVPPIPQQPRGTTPVDLEIRFP